MSTIQVPTIAAVISLVAAVLGQRASRQTRSELHALTAEQPDPNSNVLLPNAMSLRLEPELRWAASSKTQVGVAVFRFLGAHPDRAARALRDNMRGGENAYQLRANEFAIAFWNVSSLGTRQAIRRLGRALEASEAEIVEVGHALFPTDGNDYRGLIDTARRRRSVLQFADTADDHVTFVPLWLRSITSSAAGILLAACCVALVSSRSTTLVRAVG